MESKRTCAATCAGTWDCSVIGSEHASKEGIKYINFLIITRCSRAIWMANIVNTLRDLSRLLTKLYCLCCVLGSSQISVQSVTTAQLYSGVFLLFLVSIL